MSLAKCKDHITSISHNHIFIIEILTVNKTYFMKRKLKNYITILYNVKKSKMLHLKLHKFSVKFLFLHFVQSFVKKLYVGNR